MIEGLPAALRAESTISTLVGTRVYPHHAPQTAVLPYIVVTQMTSQENLTMDDTSGGLRFVDFELDCKADRATESRALGKTVRDFIANYSGAAGNETIDVILFNDESTQYEPPSDGSDRGIYTTILDCTVQYTPA